MPSSQFHPQEGLGLTRALIEFWQSLSKPVGPVLLAVSGGPDSLALLHAFQALRSTYPDLQIEAAHLNHLIRGEAATADARFVAEFCKVNGVPCHLTEFDVLAWASLQHLSLEDAARRVRYAWFARLCQERSSSLVLLAHHADDQAETVLLRLLRGTGPGGLAAMSPLAPFPPLDPRLQTWFGSADVTNLRLGRPFLSLWRREIETYCAAHELQPRQDETNFSTDYLRNRVRLELLPQIETAYSPHFRANLVRLAALAGGEEEWLSGLVEIQYAAQVQSGKAERGFNLAYFAVQPRALQRRLLRAALADLNKLSDVEAAHIEAVIDLFAAGATGRLNLPGGVVAYRWRGQVGFRLAEPNPIAWPGEDLRLTVPGGLDGPDAEWNLEARLLEARQFHAQQAIEQEADKFRAWVDYAKIGPALLVRPRRSGERFRPLGAPGRRKVQDVLLDAGILREQRAGWPLVVCSAAGDEPEKIVWIPGASIAHDFRVTEETQVVCELRLLMRS